MPLVTWSEKYSVGIPTIDKQHQQLFDIINKLNDAMIQGKSKEILDSVLNELIQYTDSHFKTEEDLFVKSHYPERTQHVTLHNNLRAKVLDFQTRFRSGKETISIELLTFIRDWLSSHILVQDKKYYKYLKE